MPSAGCHQQTTRWLADANCPTAGGGNVRGEHLPHRVYLPAPSRIPNLAAVRNVPMKLRAMILAGALLAPFAAAHARAQTTTPLPVNNAIEARQQFRAE